jgi:hypothetical protein
VTVLRERTVWRRPRPLKLTDRPDELTADEQANVRRALRHLRDQHGSWERLAVAMGIKPWTLWQGTVRRTWRPTAGFALRAAKLAGAPWRQKG